MRAESTLAGYARAAVELKTRMDEHCRSRPGRCYVETFLDVHLATLPPAGAEHPKLVNVVEQITGNAWRIGEAYVLAPAMTAIVAAAAQALDLTGEVLTTELAPADFGVLFLPEPIYRRWPSGAVGGVAAITWARLSTQTATWWAISGWAERDDPDDPDGQRIRAEVGDRLRTLVGPYVLTDLDLAPIGEPMPRREVPVDAIARDWQTAPDGRYLIDMAQGATPLCTAVLYAFWRIQAQPLATVTTLPPDRATRRRAVRARVVHGTRVVTLRRVHAVTEGEPEPRWRYRVRFVVRGHWRRLVDKNGQPYRIWINAHIKGPDGAPLLTGEIVAVLAR